MARVLERLLHAGEAAHYQDPKYNVQLLRLATRISINRTVAGMHFPVDNLAGAVLGLILADYLVARATCTSGKCDLETAFFNGAAFDNAGGTQDFVPEEFIELPGMKLKQLPWLEKLLVNGERPKISGKFAPRAVSWLWKQSKKEWREKDA